MTNIIKTCFSTTKRKVISIICIAIAASLIGTTTAYAVSYTTAIGKEAAEYYAYADAGVDPAAVEYVVCEFELEDGTFVYDIEFTSDGNEYEYWIKASDGTVLKKEADIVKLESSAQAKTSESSITLDEAKAIALEDANVAEGEITITESKLEYEDSMSIYTIEFFDSDAEYEYEINATTGEIYSKSIETKISTTTTTAVTTESVTTITLDEAKEIALDNASLNESDVAFTKTKSDTEDGVAVYEIEFNTSTKEYEYTIRATDGKVIEKSVEAIEAITTSAPTTDTSSEQTSKSTSSQSESAVAAESKATTTTVVSEQIIVSQEADTASTSEQATQTTSITLDKAKAIALADASLSQSDVTFTKAKSDMDDGVAVYDIEFVTSTKEYEYEIRATDGMIIDKSVEQLETANTTANTSSSTETITLDRAKQIALDKAGLSESQVTFEKAKLDEDDGIMVYEIEFRSGNREYECTVNASNGNILEYEVDDD